ncbi:MAG: caspase family protein, partial [Myxococcales bacterium]|nr:caspase family protein [Myxococcales bacterium]
PLRFADDDAARVGELLRELGVDVELATTLDRDSQAIFTEITGTTRAPTRAGVLAAHAALVERMKRARASGGGGIEYMIYYSGHGDVGPDGKGYLTLAGGDKLSRHDLFVELLGGSPADHNHIIVDACKSEEFVLSRGGEWKPDRTEVDYSRDVQDYLDRRHLGHFPNTGVVLASSADQQTHEWERYRGGIFTHELLSGLRGGADVNGDGDIEYSELGAFVSAANSGVADPRARLRVSVRPPRDNERLPLLSHDDALRNERVLLFTQGDAHRYALEDRRGVRLADVRRSGEQPGYLRLPPGELFVYRDPPAGDAGAGRQLEGRIAAGQGRVILAQDLHFQETSRAARGALDQAFRDGLFAVPYGVGYYSGYTGRTGLLPVQQPGWDVKVWREEGGELVEVTDARSNLQAAPEGPAPADQCYGDGCDEALEDWDDDEEWEDWVWRPERFWGALSVGVIFAPARPQETIRLTNDEQKITAADTQPWGGPVRGFDIAWQTFSIHRKKYPVFVGYFHSGYTRGAASFSPRELGGSPEVGEATSMTYGAIPLYLGGNLYLF